MKIPALPSRSLVRRLALNKLAFVFVLSAICYLLFAAVNVHAYSDGSVKVNQEQSNLNSSPTTADTLNTNSDVPKNLHSVTQVVMLETMSAMVCQLSGYDPISADHRCLGVDAKTGKIGFVENGGGLIAVMGTMIDATFTPPASSGQYVAYLQNNFGVAKTAYAQENPCANNDKGIGFCGLLPIIDLWVAMRNIVYLILILAFVVIGLGIMLRIHIDPRTVMTVQNQIPKIIVGILAITFSFAIAGFLIDVMYVAVYLFAGVIAGAAETDSTVYTKIVQAANPFDAANSIANGGIINIAGNASQALAELVSQAFDDQSSNLGIINDIIHPIVSVLAFLVFLIAIVVALIRLWVTLIITYVNIILDVIFAPFWILTGILPGSNLGVGAWLKDLLANLAVFPVAISFFLLANYFVDAFAKSDTDNTNIINTTTLPLLGGTDAPAVAAIIGLGFILMLPNVLTTTKAAFKAPKINLGPIMGPVKAGAGIVGGPPRRLVGGVISESTRTRYVDGKMEEPKGISRAIRVFRGGH